MSTPHFGRWKESGHWCDRTGKVEGSWQGRGQREKGVRPISSALIHASIYRKARAFRNQVPPKELRTKTLVRTQVKPTFFLSILITRQPVTALTKQKTVQRSKQHLARGGLDPRAPSPAEGRSERELWPAVRTLSCSGFYRLLMKCLSGVIFHPFVLSIQWAL